MNEGRQNSNHDFIKWLETDEMKYLSFKVSCNSQKGFFVKGLFHPPLTKTLYKLNFIRKVKKKRSSTFLA